mgnify:CR=1 FL=1
MGRDQTFEALLAEHGAMLRRIASAYEADRERRRELEQDILLAVWRALPKHRGDAPLRHFIARVAHNRAVTQLAQRTGTTVNDVTNMTIWGNHSVTQFADLYHAKVKGKNAYEAVNDHEWYASTYLPTVAKRGAAIIEARGASSAASAANAAVDHIRNWTLGTAPGDWVSMAVPSDGSYGVPEGLISSFPCTCANGEYSIVQGLDINEFSRAKIDASVAELVEERDAVKDLGLI